MTDIRTIIRKILFPLVGLFGVIVTPVMFPIGYFIFWLDGTNDTIKEEWNIYKEALYDMIVGEHL